LFPQSNRGTGRRACTRGTSNREPEFYIRLSDEERFAIIRLAVHKGTRLVENVTIVPVANENVEEPDIVERFAGKGRYGLQDLAVEAAGAGEYAVVEYTEGK